MSEPTITCPSCKTEFPLTASLAAPLVETMRRDFAQQLAAKESETAQRKAALKDREAAMVKAQATLEAQVADRVADARATIAAEESAKAKTALDAQLGEKQAEITALNDALKQRNEKVAELQKAQQALARQRQELEDAKNELDATLAEKLRAEREKIAADAEQRARLALQDDLDARSKEVVGLQELLGSQRAKLQSGIHPKK